MMEMMIYDGDDIADKDDAHWPGATLWSPGWAAA